MSDESVLKWLFNHTYECVITLSGTEPTHQKQYRGSGTVWNAWPSAVKCSTALADELCEIWTKAKWRRDDGALTPLQSSELGERFIKLETDDASSN